MSKNNKRKREDENKDESQNSNKEARLENKAFEMDNEKSKEQYEISPEELAIIIKNYIKENNEAGINQLLEKGYDINEDLESPILHYAIYINNEYMFKCLLSKGADMYAKDEKGMNAMAFAIDSNQRDMVEVLIKAGYDFNHESDRSICMAAQNYNNPMLEFLVNHGADINAIDEYGHTILYHTYYSETPDKSFSTIKKLIGLGATYSNNESYGNEDLKMLSDISDQVLKEQDLVMSGELLSKSSLD